MLKIQKALHLHLEQAKVKPNYIGKTYHVFEKFDGWYLFIDCINGKWQGIRNKKGLLLPSMSHFSKLFEEVITPTKVDIRLCFEGTLLEKGEVPMIFSKLNGMFNQKHTPLCRGVRVDSKTFGEVLIHDIKLKVHDLILLDGTPKRFKDRYEDLKAFTRKAVNVDDLLWFNVVPIIGHSNDPARWQSMYEFIITKYDCQGEGIILKESNALYHGGKRNSSLMKIKCEKSFELLVIGIEEGEGKYRDTLGKLVVQDANGVINKISGMSDHLRNLWWETPSLIKGKIVEIACMKVLPNKSLREGRFKAIRHDKDEIDTL